MTDSADEPDWNLLPDDPIGFFGLKSGFDQKDLKRRYNALIRRFKPEKHPLPFQKIRAAFESLDRRFSAGAFHSGPFRVVQIHDEEIQLAWDEMPAEKRDSASSSRRRLEPIITLLDRVRNTPPQRLHAELRLATAKTRDERLLWAFLEDADVGGPSTAFLDGLLVAARTNRDEETWDLLRQYLQSQEARARCIDILERIFFVLASDDVFPLTEPLWDELQSRVPFAEFRTILDNCVRHVKGHHAIQRLMFEIRLLRRTLFYAEPNWTAQRLTRLTQGDVNWPEWLDHQIWSLEQLVSYTKIRPRFLNGNPLRSMLDEVLQAYCADEPEFDRLYLNFQAKILHNFDDAAQAFRRRDNAVLKVVWNVCHALTEQVAHRFADGDSLSVHDSLNAIGSLSARLKRSHRPLLQSPWNWSRWGWIVAGAWYLGIPAAISLLAILGDSDSPDFPLLVGPVVVLLVLLLVHLVAACIEPPTEFDAAWLLYSMQMRGEIISFVRRYPLPISMLLERLRSIDLRNAQGQKLLAEAQQDLALRFYSTAAWTLR